MTLSADEPPSVAYMASGVLPNIVGATWETLSTQVPKDKR